MSTLRIAQLGDAPALGFAVQELSRYLRAMDDSLDIALYMPGAYDAARVGLLWVGCHEALTPLLPQVADAALDDAIFIDVLDGAGIVTGTNARSVLIACYRLLTELGCFFGRPGESGERIPRASVAGKRVQVRETASYRHRGVTIEGAASYEHVAAMIDWLPKAGLNAYFTQFFTPYTFFDRWYSHKNSAAYAPEPVSAGDVDDMARALTQESLRRGLLVHAVGHGWTCEPFGIPGRDWDGQPETDVPESVRPLLAEIGGKRGLFDRIALNTQLCFGNEKARAGVVDAIVQYALARPEVDYLHFWLADGANNHCECALCRDTLPSDFYVMMLNEIDARLTACGARTHIVFLIYVDLLWAPARERIAHPERFALMFAPITRTYTTPFIGSPAQAAPAPAAPAQAASGIPEDIPAYARNANRMPRSVAANVRMLRDWQAQFSGDSFDFDYHLMWDYARDMGCMGMARVLFDDMRNLSELGLHGMVSCQVQRIAFPNGLPLALMARALWNREACFEDECACYFAGAYGDRGELVRAYLTRLSELLDAPYVRGEKPAVDFTAASRYASIPAYVAEYLPQWLGALETAEDEGMRGGFRMLVLHAQLVTLLARALAAKAAGQNETALKRFDECAQYAYAIEPQAHECFDVQNFVNVNRGAIRRDME